MKRLFLISLLTLGITSSIFCNAPSTSQFFLTVEKLSLKRIEELRIRYQKRIRKNEILRGTFLTDEAAIGIASIIGCVKYLRYNNKKENDIPDTTNANNQNALDDDNKKINDIYKLILKREEQKQSFSYQCSQQIKITTAWLCALTIVRGVSSGFTSITNMLWNELKKIWFNQKYYYMFWRGQILAYSEIINNLLQSLEEYSEQSKNVQTKSPSSTLLFSRYSQIVDRYRQFMFAVEHIVTLMTLESKNTGRIDVERIKHVMNTFSQKLEKTLSKKDQQEQTASDDVIPAFQELHDTLVLIMQSYQARIEM